MLVTGWQKMITKAGRSQRSTAQALSVNSAEFSLVVNGRAFLPLEKLDRACELLGCRRTDLYDEGALALLYKIKPKEVAPKRRVRVELDEDTQAFVEQVADRMGMTRTQAANYIIRTWRVEA